MGNIKQRDEAINLAMQGRWEEAIMVNKGILEVSPNDIGALNRTGKAMAELGRNSEAFKSYERVLQLDPYNSIAQKNLQRLSNLKDQDGTPKESRKIDSKFFIEETSKAKTLSLIRIATKEILDRMAAGDPVNLLVNENSIEIVNDSNEYLGEVESKIAMRLIKLMDGGNEYKAAITSLNGDEIRVIIRETFQHPSQEGYSSFPPPKIKEDIKPYLKNTIVKHEIDESPTDRDEADDWGRDEKESLETEDISPEDEVSTLDKVA